MLKAFILGAMVIHGADATTTNIAIGRGAFETNWFQASKPAPAAVWTQQGGEALGFAWTETHFSKTHRRLVWIAVIADIAAESWAVRGNIQNIVALNHRHH